MLSAVASPSLSAKQGGEKASDGKTNPFRQKTRHQAWKETHSHHVLLLLLLFHSKVALFKFLVTFPPSRKRKGEKFKEGSNRQRAERVSGQEGGRGSSQEGAVDEVDLRLDDSRGLEFPFCILTIPHDIDICRLSIVPSALGESSSLVSIRFVFTLDSLPSPRLAFHK